MVLRAALGFLVASLVAACTLGADAPGEREERTSAPRPEVSPASARPTLALHAWGVVDVRIEDAEGSASFAPVVYARLEASEPRPLYLAMSAGELVDAWPAPAEPSRAAWRGVVAPVGPCEPAPIFPETPDTCGDGERVCAARDAARYAAPDASCITIGERAHPFVLHRVRVPRAVLPFDVRDVAGSDRGAGARPEEGRQIVAREGAAPVVIVHVGTYATGGGLALARATRVEGTGVIPPLPDDLEGASTAVGELLRGAALAGLTEAEARVFSEVWKPAVAGPYAPYDALYYWLDPESAERILPIVVEPRAAEIRRAILVRIVLAESSGVCAPGVGGGSASPARVARVRFGEIRVVGPISRRDARGVVRLHVDEIRACYELGLARSLALAGRFDLDLEIGVAGDVLEVSASGGTLAVPQVEQWVVGRARRWSFPPSAAPSRARFDIRLDSEG